MRYAAFMCAALVLSGCKYAAEDQKLTDAVQADVSPVVIAQVEGVKLWKVRDKTGGAADWVYFTTRGDVAWEEKHTCGKGCTRTDRYQVPGAR